MINCSALQCNLHCNTTWWYAEQCTLLWQMCPLPSPSHLWANLWQNLPIDPIAPHPRPFSPPTWDPYLPVFITMSVCVVNLHRMWPIQVDKEQGLVRGGLVQIGDQLAPERPRSGQGKPGLHRSDSRHQTSDHTHWRKISRDAAG